MENREKLFLKGRLAYSFGKNGGGLSNEFDLLNQLINLFGKDNFITIHKSFVDQTDDVYDLIFDIAPKEDVNYLFKDPKDEVETVKYRSQDI